MENRKNCWLISTDKPSRLLKTIPKSNLILSKSITSGSHWENQNIYITNSEEIKEGNWFINKFYIDKRAPIASQRFAMNSNAVFNNPKKIILTTDPDLIADGVQAIDDKFLEWFVKNPGCEEVEVGYGWIRLTETNNEGYWVSIPDNQFEMQQEEPKCTCKEHDLYCCQVHGTCPTCVKKECTCENPTDNTCDYCEKENKIEILEEAKKIALEKETLEEAAEIYEETDFITTTPTTENAQQMIQRAFIGGAKWQQERMYTEEDMIKFAKYCNLKDDLSVRELLTIWFDQYKKK